MKDQVLCGIYAIRNKANGKMYFGSSADCRRRFGEHISRLRRGAHINAKLQSAWLKHGADSFVFELICSVIDQAALATVEQLILDDRRAVVDGYNLSPTAGNTLGWRASEETRARMSAAAKLRDNSVQVAAMARATKGKPRPQYVLAAMRRGKMNTPTTDKTRAKMAASAIARSRYSQDDRREMARLKDSGASFRHIGGVFGVPHTCVIKYVAQWRAANGH